MGRGTTGIRTSVGEVKEEGSIRVDRKDPHGGDPETEGYEGRLGTVRGGRGTHR